MNDKPRYRLRQIALGTVLLCIWGGPALSQQSGTVLRGSLTLLGGPSTTMEIDIAGPKSANSQTDLLLEFGPDGNSRTNPVPDPSLSPATTFTISASFGGSRTFPVAGGVETHLFADKIISLSLLDQSSAPGLYSLSIIHRQEIPAGTTETWKVGINGLPQAGLRVIGSVGQGTFRSLVPTGVSQGPPAIAIDLAPIAVGSAPTLTVRSSGGLDLSNVSLQHVSIAPNDGISNISIGNATPNSAILSFNIANCTRPVPRTLTIRDQNVAASAVLPLAGTQQMPTLTVRPDSVTTSSTATLNVTSTGCFDLSQITPAQVLINPSDGISNLAVGALSATTLSLSFAVAGNAPTTSRRLVITNGDSSAATAFQVARPAPPVHPPHHVCAADQHCCEDDGNGSCTLCIPRARQCM
jgi:hypothetical protein